MNITKFTLEVYICIFACTCSSYENLRHNSLPTLFARKKNIIETNSESKKTKYALKITLTLLNPEYPPYRQPYCSVGNRNTRSTTKYAVTSRSTTQVVPFELLPCRWYALPTSLAGSAHADKTMKKNYRGNTLTGRSKIEEMIILLYFVLFRTGRYLILIGTP